MPSYVRRHSWSAVTAVNRKLWSMLNAERVIEDMAQQLEAAAPPDLARLRRVDALNGYGIQQQGGHCMPHTSMRCIPVAQLLAHLATAKLASWLAQNLTLTPNTLYDSQRQIVVTSDKLPHEIPENEERLRNRFQWGLIADVQAPEIETCCHHALKAG